MSLSRGPGFVCMVGQETFSELMGKRTGCANGKGGSMHLYKRENCFWGGWGIVGTSPPLGSGLAFAHKYLKKPNVVVAIYGDGAANQVFLLPDFCLKNYIISVYLQIGVT